MKLNIHIKPNQTNTHTLGHSVYANQLTACGEQSQPPCTRAHVWHACRRGWVHSPQRLILQVFNHKRHGLILSSIIRSEGTAVTTAAGVAAVIFWYEVLKLKRPHRWRRVHGDHGLFVLFCHIRGKRITSVSLPAVAAAAAAAEITGIWFLDRMYQKPEPCDGRQ